MSDIDTTKLKVRYDDTAAQYASQVILNTTQEEFLLDFSSGVIPDADSGEPCVPIHTRIAMSASGAKRLHSLLGKALNIPG